MSVKHGLFLIKNNRITAVLNEENGFEVIKFGGNTAVEYNDEFWEMWREYAGFIKNDLTDFCFIYDGEMPCISDFLKGKECSEDECIWNRYSIQDVVKLLEIVHPTVIVNQRGVCIAKAGPFKNAKETDIVRLTAIYRKSKSEILSVEEKDVEITPFIEEMLEKLKEYDEEN